jgi:hypothetical protein
MYRRRVLSAIALVLLGPAAGCLGGSGGSDVPGTADLPTRLWFERVELTESERNAVDPIVFADLPAAERELVATALDEGEYVVESEAPPPALDSLRDRIERRADGGLAVYLQRNRTYYRVGFAEGDHIVAHPSQ